MERNSVIEITATEYCIKLKKEAFSLSLVREFIKRIQSEERFFSKQEEETEGEEEWRNQVSISSFEHFDHLSEK